ncbi:hypothetical protein FC70_GL001076 [Paucilactobacillus oligofermentans DSM 15707 = LMG 22743]|uniref:Universal stress protein n=1 Tax=Paucilactobacillus oligofermentans DSM 15707 = LMG 22743 TaxID=1423778 RepID=A0A0R1RF14_9LACO|nr:universal stress protein [Paucilactobacillus oligofermentans]KRL55479.1 hypothetical protein FC70_GL001076 [Paucilactobacillus oligofermentans DSM 15707 = LMG 22743]CUS25536.1 Universal stress protein [Paucilactobacillus oligofermentans DSM 15707 = LMG 22743]
MNQVYQNILVPMDGSKNAKLALEKAVSVAKRNHAHIHLLNVLDTRSVTYNYAGMSDGSITYQLVGESKEYLSALADHLRSTDSFTDVDIHIRLGNPKTVISYDFPQDHPVDLIIMGASGLSAVQRAMMGSVTSFVNRNATADVLVVRTPLETK